MKEPDFLFEIADFPLDKPIIITHSDFEWDDEKKEIIRVTFGLFIYFWLLGPSLLCTGFL